LEVEAPATPPLAAPIDPVAAALAAAAANGAVPAAKATTAAAVPRVSVPRSSRSGSLRPGSLNTVPRPLKGCRDKDQDKDRDKDREPPPPLSEGPPPWMKKYMDNSTHTLSQLTKDLADSRAENKVAISVLEGKFSAMSVDVEGLETNTSKTQEQVTELDKRVKALEAGPIASGNASGSLPSGAPTPSGRFISRYVEIKDWCSLSEKEVRGATDEDVAAWRPRVAPKCSANARKVLEEAELVVEWELNIAFKLWAKDTRSTLPLADALRRPSKAGDEDMKMKGKAPRVVPGPPPEVLARRRAAGRWKRGAETALAEKKVEGTVDTLFWEPFITRVKLASGQSHLLGRIDANANPVFSQSWRYRRSARRRRSFGIAGSFARGVS